VNRNGYQHRFLVAPNNLSQTVWASGKESFCVAGRLCSTLQRHQSAVRLLANASKTDIINNGLPGAAIQ